MEGPLHAVHQRVVAFLHIVFYLTEVFVELCKLGQSPDEARGLLVVGTEGEDSLVGGVGGGFGVAGQGGVVGGEGLSLERQAGCEFFI